MTRAECVNVRIRCSMRSELFWREWRGSSSPPSSKPGDCAGSFERPVPFRADPRRLQALIQNSRAASRGGLRLGGLVILFVAHGGPRQGIGGGPVHHAGLDKRERLAGPSVPSFATPYSWVELTPRLSERAGWRTPRTAIAPLPRNTNGGSVQMIENGSNSEIGPKAYRRRRWSPRGARIAGRST